MITSGEETTLDLRRDREDELKIKATQPPTVVVKDWSMVIALRTYQPGNGCLPYIGSKVLGKHGVVHCDILMKRPCGDIWCGKCVQDPECAECIRCPYREIAYVQGETTMKEDELRAARNAAHGENIGMHIVTYTARDRGVMCQVDRLFTYNTFYSLQVDEFTADDVDAFFLNQIGPTGLYNWTGYFCNFVACMRFCCPCGTRWYDLVDGNVTKRKWFCSELVGASLYLAGAQGFTEDTKPKQEPCALTPDEIADIVMKYPEFYSEISRKDVMLALQDDDDVADDDEA